MEKIMAVLETVNGWVNNFVWGVPVLAAAAFGGGFLVWLVLRRVPVVKTYLI